MNTFTRTISPAVRVGYMVLPAKLSAALQEKISFYSCTVPVFTQHLLAELIRNGDFERHINRVRRRRRQGAEPVTVGFGTEACFSYTLVPAGQFWLICSCLP